MSLVAAVVMVRFDDGGSWPRYEGFPTAPPAVRRHRFRSMLEG